MEMNKQGDNNSNAGKFCVHNSVPCYSEQEAKALEERLNNEETFGEAVQVVISWLQRGQCDESNSLQFSALIQLCLNYKEKLQNEQKEYFEESLKVQENLICNKRQVNEIESLFQTIKNPNILNNFSEDQIKKIHEMHEDVQSVNLDQNEKEAKIISLVSCILYRNLDGLNIEGIFSHLPTSFSTTSPEVEAVLKKHPEIYKESEEKKWSLTIDREKLALLTGN